MKKTITSALFEGEISKKVLRAYKTIEDTTVNAYRQVEKSFVETYRRIEKCTNKFDTL